MKEFFDAALPWVVMGLAIAVFFANIKKKDTNYMVQGLCLGMSAGALMCFLEVVPAPLGVSFGMLIGLTGGMLISRKDKS